MPISHSFNRKEQIDNSKTSNTEIAPSHRDKKSKNKALLQLLAEIFRCARARRNATFSCDETIPHPFSFVSLKTIPCGQPFPS
jgi:hypothetical protein